MARYETDNFDGGWIDTTRFVGTNSSGEPTYESADEQEVRDYMAALESGNAELLKACMNTDNVQDALGVISSLKQVQENFNDVLVGLEAERDELRAALEWCLKATVYERYRGAGLGQTRMTEWMTDLGLMQVGANGAVWRWSEAAKGVGDDG